LGYNPMDRVLATARLPATVGEWVQGWIEGRESLVSLVVEWSGSVDLCCGGGDTLAPSTGSKAQRAFLISKELYSRAEHGEHIPNDSFIDVTNTLPVARGLATSTMDIAGTFAACASFAGVSMTDERLLSLCAGIEASDGIMFSGLALIDHINGTLRERLPSPPDMVMVVVIPNRTLDTSDYRGSAARMARVTSLSETHEQAYYTLKKGLITQNPAMVAEAATISASAQQSVIPRREWDLLQKARSLSGALGIAVAHSGTASGLLYEPQNLSGADMAEKWLKGSLEKFLDEHIEIRRTSVTGGGFRARRL
jgi:L-threonine kinase